jgi:DNA-directed RNA polymerase subunit L
MMNVKLISVKLDRKEIKDIPDMKKVIGIDEFPLVNTYVSIEIKGITTAYINAVRRTAMDELHGFAFQIPSDMDWKDTTDEFILPQFVNQRISLIPLKNNLGPEYASIRYDLIGENTTTLPLALYTKDLKLIAGKVIGPIFNPTFKICVLQPGRKISIRGIYIGTGMGKDNAIFQRVRCGAYSHLDIEQYDKKETHLPNGSQVDYSGYKKLSTQSNPLHHLFTCIIPATGKDPAEVIAIFIDVCNNIKERLRYILSYIESNSGNTHSNQGIEYTVFQLSEGIYEGILFVNNETHTIGEMIRRTIFDLNPDIINVIYAIIAHEDRLKIIIRYKEHVTRILVKALKYCISVYDVLQKQFAAYK